MRSKGADPGSSRPNFIAFAIGLGLVILLLAGCAGPTVISTPNSCASLLPQEWRQGVAGAEMPTGDTVGDWIAFGDAQTGKLDQANGRTKDAIGIVERCEARDAAAVKRATRRWWQIF
jgi:hypothetical protein